MIARDISEQKRSQEALRQSQAELKEAQRIASVGSWTWEPENDTVTWSEEVYRVFGRDPKLPPHCVSEQLQYYRRDSGRRLQAALREALQNGTPYELDAELVLADGATRWTIIRGEAERDTSGRIVRLRGTLQDVTERKRAEQEIRSSLREKETLLKEIHHRVKNNMQVISSLYSLQAGKGADARTRELIDESRNRIRSMALIHEKLYRSKDLTRIEFAEYTRSLAAELFRSYRLDPEAVNLVATSGDVWLDIDAAIPCGLIVNELLSNSLKHAFSDGRKGTIAIRLSADDDRTVRLTVRDDGRGLPPDFDIRSSESFGLQLVKMLTEQLGGSIAVQSEAGTCFELAFSTSKR